jgi:Leucine-rich repeat (LRR) protein
VYQDFTILPTQNKKCQKLNRLEFTNKKNSIRKTNEIIHSEQMQVIQEPKPNYFTAELSIANVPEI